jgi:acyl-CoA thioesterase
MRFPFAELIGLTFEEQGEGTSILALDIRDDLFNPQHVVHGGALYALADTGMGTALYSLLQENEYCATIEIKISYFKPVTTGTLTCRTTVINKGKRGASMESEIWNEGKLVAKASGSFAIFVPSRK